MSHTAGPWTLDRDGSTVVLGGQRTIVAPAPDGASRAEECANARLIAAAPDLLSALQAIVEAGRMSDNSRARYCAEIARAAIRKTEVTA